MPTRAVFEGLVFDEEGDPVAVAHVGDIPHYVVDDDGFLRHIESEKVDRQVMERFAEFIRGNEDMISEGTMKMIGQDDIFTKAVIDASLKNMDAQFDQLLQHGLPEDARTWLGMIGFHVVIDVQGEVLHVEQPTAPDEDLD
jgi:hypothetical protein